MSCLNTACQYQLKNGWYINETWRISRLTAFVAKTFAEALNGNYIYIDSQNVLLPAYKFMLTDAVIDKEGKVVENGEVYHSEMQVCFTWYIDQIVCFAYNCFKITKNFLFLL